MPIGIPASVSTLAGLDTAGAGRPRPRIGFLWGASLATLITALGANAARAQSVAALMAATRQSTAAATSAATSPASPGGSSSAAMATAAANALRYQTQVNSALNLAQQAQAAAKATAAALNQNAAAGIIDGLGIGGLQPAVTAVTNASADPVGVATWQGANLPTTSASSPNQVTVTQTQPNAVLSWTTFNVGQHTTLNFQQQSNGVSQPGWVVLNRVVGVLDPITGLPLTGGAPAPSQILGSINAPGTVLVLNQNGILFGPTSQVNVNSLVATSLEIGRAFESDGQTTRTLAQRNTEFLDFGILGYSESNPNPANPTYEFSSQVLGKDGFGNLVYDSAGQVTVQAGASLTTGANGYLLLLAPNVSLAGQLTAADGEVGLQAGNLISLAASTGTSTSADPNVRGLVVSSTLGGISNAANTVDVASNAIIQSPRGYVSLGATASGAITDAGVITSTTSINENGYVNISAPTINIAPNAVIAINPDSSTATLPQDSTSLANFKSSQVRIGVYQPGSHQSDGSYSAPYEQPALIDIGANSLIYAPNANIVIGAAATANASGTGAPTTGVTVESGAIIDAAGLTNVVVPASRNTLEINPVLGNELADSPAFRTGFLNGAVVYLDPRLSGVTANGVAWVGSPLISAAAYAQQVGIPVTELMVAGGNISIGVASAAPGGAFAQAPSINVKPGAVIDISGGWKTYQAGEVIQSYLIDATGAVIPISQANPDTTYVGLYNGYSVDQARWGVTQTYGNALLTGAHYEGQYTEGRDAGSLTLTGSVVALDGQFNAGAFAGTEQIVAATPGTAAATLLGDQRLLQAASSQLPSGGYLSIDASGGGGDIAIEGAASYAPGPSTTIGLNADALTASGLSELSLQTTGRISVSSDAVLDLAAGGAFNAIAGRAITVNGSISAPSGSINLSTLGGQGLGSVFTSEPVQAGFADIVLNGGLNVAGLWSNDYGAAPGQLVGSAFLNGGAITLTPAAQQTLYPITDSTVLVNQDVSGSILINPGAVLNLSGGGYVSPAGAVTVTAKGGNLNLVDNTNYYNVNPFASSTTNPKFRVLDPSDGASVLEPLPAYITSRVSIADGSILDAGFGGGGTFSLTTPSFTLGAVGASSMVSASCGQNGSACGATLPADFFTRTGFANYRITSNGTDLLYNVFDGALGGYSGVLATQVVEVKSGQTLSLSESYFSNVLSEAQLTALRTLGSGSSLYSVLTPSAPTDTYDQRSVNLTLGGLLELHVDAGGQVVGAPGAKLTSSELWNQGVIDIPGGTITQTETNYATTNSVGVSSLSQVFGAPLADGSYSQSATNVFFTSGMDATLTNAQVAENISSNPTPIYFLGDLNAGEAVRLSPGSVTNLAGVAIVNPRAAPKGETLGSSFVSGTVIGGGSFIANGVIGGAPKGVTAEPGSVLDLAGAQATFDQPTLASATGSGGNTLTYSPTLVWSNGGNLTLNEGGSITGATIQAQGGAPLALGGVLSLFNPVLYQNDPTTPTANAISAAAVTSAGFATFVAQGSLTSVGDVTLTLPRSVFIESAPTSTGVVSAPTIGSGGALEIDAPYIALYSGAQSIATPVVGTVADNSLTLKATAIDVTGAVLLDESIGQATLSASGDIRFIGAAPNATEPASTLIGRLAANGDITLNSSQVYPATGTTFTVSTTGVSSPTKSKGGTITFDSVGATPGTPYSAGGSLTVLAANINQDGVVRVPLGALTLGSNTGTTFAPATVNLTLGATSTTSISADGLNIPYGTTTDKVEWYFTPTQSSKLTGAPVGVLQLAGGSITASTGATVNLKGGGDVYAYEFISGTGGTRDVLSQFNSDIYSSTNGYQYPDGRQIYAIVPGLSSASIATQDPIYSANYSSLYAPSQAGLSVYLNAAPGLAAGYYTLLPAQYALLPGGMRVVQDTSAATPAVTSAGLAQGTVQSDGTIVTSGYFSVAGVNTRGATPVVFDVQSQSVILNESNIALTEGNRYFSALAATSGVTTPRLPIDAGQLILAPLTGLTLGANFETTPANLPASGSDAALSGRGAVVDISGTSLAIDDPAHIVTAPTGSIVLTDVSLSSLNAASLFLGGVATDNADGTTSLDVTSKTITLEAGATLSAPEIVLAVDGRGSKITLDAGASIKATGSVMGEASGNYIINGLATDGARVQDAQGAFLRVSDGPQRLLTRLNVAGAGGSLIVGPRGSVVLDGASIDLNSLGALSLSSSAKLKATDIALGAATILVGPKGAGLLLTPTLQTILADTKSVTLESQNAITFDTGTYAFQNLSLDTPGLTAAKSGNVTLNVSGAFSLAASNKALAACNGAKAFACGTGSLSVNAATIALGSGDVQTYGTGGQVNLTATNGVFVDGAATLNVGGAALDITTPFLGDRGTGLANATLPSLDLITTAALTLTSATPASAFTAPAGTPGSNLTISAGSVSITGTELRATAGTLNIAAASGISIDGGALLATPSYARVFGDSADPTTVSAPGGSLSLLASTGNISISDDSMLAVGGTQGQAGSLSLTAQNGSVFAYHGTTSDVVSLASTVSAKGGGGSLTLDTGGAFDLSAFSTGNGQQFTGAVAVRSGAGDLTLAAGDTLTATSVSLTADGGQVTDAGTINTSGVNGGAVSLYGETGVHLTATALISAQAKGYGSTSTLQAAGGDVVLGVDGSGAIAVDQGAVINVSAANTENRLVNLNRTNGTYYTYVSGDVGGTVTLRAPVITQSNGAETVNVAVQGDITGAKSVTLQGFQRYNLNDLAANSNYVGVSVSGGTATLDLNATGPGVINVLADTSGPIVQFIQNFNVSSVYGALGGLASQANFHAMPGVELDYAGNITLASNWNLGAGVVNIPAAVAAGLMAPDPGLPGQYSVVGATAQALAANEGLILANYTTATYRVGGSFFNEPGVLTLRASGNLTLNGSLTDGFFQFADQTDPNYLNQVLGGGNRVYQASLSPTTDGTNVSIVFPNAVGLNFPNGVSVAASYVLPNAPYSAVANSPGALGDIPVSGGALISGTGDPLGSAQLFPLLPQAGGGSVAAASWSYQLVAGAALTAPGGGSTFQPSVNPLTVMAGAPANVVVQGLNVYGYKAVAGAVGFGDSLNLLDANGVSLAPQAWLSAFESQNALDDSAPTEITFGSRAVKLAIDGLEAQFAAANPSDAITVTPRGNIDTTLGVAAQFMTYVSNNFSQIAPNYTAPTEAGIGSFATYATAPTLVRTGTGNISVAAAGMIDLRNGNQTVSATTGLPTETPLTLSGSGVPVNAATDNLHLGGAAIYTAGATAVLGLTTATDVSTGTVYTVDLAANANASDNLSNQSVAYTLASGVTGGVAGAYTYGGGSAPSGIRTGYAGILIADPAYSQNGGNVTLTAGTDVLSRRNTSLESDLGGFGYVSIGSLPAWAGVGDQPWRTGSVGGIVNLQTDPQLFSEGVGTLGGGNITIRAGGVISDLSTVASDSITTASVTGAASNGQSLALVNLGYGGISETAGGNILGGRLDVAAGNATVRTDGSIISAGQIFEEVGADDLRSIPNTLSVRLSDGVVTLEATGSATVESIGAMGISTQGSFANSKSFYAAGSGVDILADGFTTVTNSSIETGLGLTAFGQGNVYPGSFEAVSFTADLTVGGSTNHQSEVLLVPDPTGTLTLLAAGNLAAGTIAQLDSNPTLLPGIFTEFSFGGSGSAGVTSGLDFGFPAVLPTTPDATLRLLHNPSTTHAGDQTPDRIAAGEDITDFTLSVDKQTRVAAGRDIVNMVFLGQNVSANDVTRITAGRDITATTALNATQDNGPLLPTVQGNTFLLGGPGSLFIEAGRNAGPFLNSAVTSGGVTWGGGIIAVGNGSNPWLPAQSASIYTEFGVANGQNYAGLVSTYLDPSNFASLPGYLFIQTTDANGIISADRTQEVYTLSLVPWLKSVASSLISSYDTAAGVKSPSASAPAFIQFLVKLQNGGTATTAQALAYLPDVADQAMPLIPWLQLHEPTVLTQAFGTLDVTYAQAFAAFQSLPTLTQREFLIPNVYFNELVQTSVPSSASYLDYSRGYIAVNTLFPASYGYTANSLSGGPAGASSTVHTGNLDLRLATIQTDQGGGISVLGPGGEVLAGSVVSTSVQASAHYYAGEQLYEGLTPLGNSASAITSIPPGYEGILTLRGGSIDSFTDVDFLLNQSRAFTEQGGNIAIWSSNADVNAGQGPRTTADVQPAVVHIDQNAYSQVDTTAAVSGAGIGAFGADSSGLSPDVFLLAPRGTVDAGAAGVRSSGNIFIAAFQVANTAGIQASGTVSGAGGPAAVNVSAQTGGDAAASAAAQAAQAASSQTATSERPLIFVDVLGYLPDEPDLCSPQDVQLGKCR